MCIFRSFPGPEKVENLFPLAVCGEVSACNWCFSTTKEENQHCFSRIDATPLRGSLIRSAQSVFSSSWSQPYMGET